MFALTHRACGHVAAVASTRDQANQARSTLQQLGQSQWRVRTATQADIAAMVDHDDCDTCRITT